MNYFSDTWLVLDEYFKSNKYFLTKHHIESYDDFISHKIINTVKVLNPFVILKNQDNGKIQHQIEVFVGGLDGSEIFINKPTVINVENNEQRLLFPNEARLRDMTYKSDIYANIQLRYTTLEGTKESIHEPPMLKHMRIGSIPIMLHSKLCALHMQPKEALKEMGECPYDQGGYFIIDGKEKVVVAQERIATNRIFINKSKDDNYSYEALIRCTSEENPLFPKTINFYVFKNEIKFERKAALMFPKISNAIVISSPNISIKIPLFILFRALGIESDKEILETICYDVSDPDNTQLLEFLRHSLVQANVILSQEDALKYLSNFVKFKHIDEIKKILLFDIFPNVGESFRSKALFLGHIVNKLVKVCMGAVKESDRDSYIFKRVDISGFMVGNLFRDYYNQFRNWTRNQIDKEYLYGAWRTTKNIDHFINKSNMFIIFRADIIEDGLKKSLKGSWGNNMIQEQQDLDNIKQGLSQDLSRLSYLGTISHLRRVNTPMDPTSKIVAPHRLHTSQWGIMCPCESPDGASIGLLKNFAIMCHVTFDVNASSIVDILHQKDLILLSNVPTGEIHKFTKVFVNNNWLGVHQDPVYLFKLLKLYKRNGIINIYTSITWNIINKEIHILTEAGRCTRPVYVIYNDNLLVSKRLKEVKKMSWDEMINSKSTGAQSLKELEENQAIIEYLDIEESNLSYIAMYPEYIQKNTQYTHCEIHPSTILSVVTHQIALCNYNQAPRNIFSGAQGKQAIGLYATNFNNRIDTMSFVLYYPQKPLVTTRYMDYLNTNKLPHGENLIVAIACYSGYNMEDAVIINKNAIERGCFNLTYYKNEVAFEEENKIENESIEFNNPYQIIESGKDLKDIKFANYKKLDENGFPIINSHISENDAYLGRTKLKIEFVADKFDENNIFGNKTKKEIYSDRSLIAGNTLSGIVDKVFVYKNDNNKKTCKLRFRKIRIPELGDKLCSRNAQKGVIGAVIPAENMPFSKDGIIPDIIINPHCIPSRMTIAHLLETVLGKIGSHMGTIIDGTPFNNNNYDELYDTMEKDYKMNRHGDEILYNGLTGEQMQTAIFMGPTYYERLKHMVGDKINYRMTGIKSVKDSHGKEHIVKTAPVSALTRQPMGGRSAGSGLRVGNMEVDSLMSHGVTLSIQESMMNRADEFTWNLDNDTEFINKKTVKDAYDLSKVRTPFAFKLLAQEIATLGVKMNFNTKYDSVEDYTDDHELGVLPEEDEDEDELKKDKKIDITKL